MTTNKTELSLEYNIKNKLISTISGVPMLLVGIKWNIELINNAASKYKQNT